MMNIIAVDPGKSKCGIVLADVKSSQVIHGRVERSNAVIPLITSWQKDQPF